MAKNKPSIKFQFLEHPADIKLQAFGKDLPELFINAALGMMQFLYGKKGEKALKITQFDVVDVAGDNLEMLLVNWLSEILYLHDVNHCNYSSYEIQEFTIDKPEHKIVAKIGGSYAQATDDIKAVTYHELSIIHTEQKGWQATVVFDI